MTISQSTVQVLGLTESEVAPVEKIFESLGALSKHQQYALSRLLSKRVWSDKKFRPRWP